MRGLNTKRLLAASAGLVLVLGVAACGDDDDSDGGGGGGGDAQLDLVIGDSIPLTGDLADFGPPGQKASDLAVAEINKAIGTAGREHTVEVVHEDNETNPQAAVSAARKLVDSDGASCITGAWASADSEPTAQSVSIPEGVLQISPASTNPGLTDLDDDGLFARTSPPDTFQGPTLADAIAADLGSAEGKTVNIGARNDDYGTALAETFSAAWEELGGTIGAEVIYDPEQPSYNSEAGEITAGNPDAFVIIDFPETFVKVGPALERTGNWDPTKAWGTDGLASSDLPGDVGPPIVEGMRGTAPGAPDEGEASAAFENALRRRRSEGSRASDVRRPAVRRNHPLLPRRGQRWFDRRPGHGGCAHRHHRSGWYRVRLEQLPEAIEALQNGDDIDYTGASGAIDMDENGDATAGVYDTYQYKGGGIETIGETPVNTGG